MPLSENDERHFQIDWLIGNLRWLLLAGVALVIFLNIFVSHSDTLKITPFLPQIILLVIAVLYNVAVVFLLSYGPPSPVVPIMTLLLDIFLTIGFILSSGGLTSPLLFFALFPILTSALRFRRLISLLSAAAVVISFGIAVYLITPPDTWSDLIPLAAFALVVLLTTLISSLVADQVKKIIARQIQREKEAEQRKLHAAREHSRLTFELASTLSATLNYNKVLKAVLEVGEKGMRELGQQGSAQVGLVLLFSHNDLRIVASSHLPPRDKNVIFQGEKGVLARVLATAEAVIIDDPAEDPELTRLVTMHSCGQAIVVPLRAGFENFGVVIFGSSQPDMYTEDLQNLLIAICNQAIVALQNAQLYQSLREEKEHIVAVEEDARKKLARDLHDGPTQSIASIAMRVNYTRMLLENSNDLQQASQELEQVEELARHTTKQIRHMLFTLRPLILETQGLKAALGQYISKLAAAGETSIHLETTPKVERALDQETQGVVFYIIDEAIGNARKHAEAENIWVRLYLRDHSAFIAEVEDDGNGFDVEAVQMSYDQRGSLGLVNMYERAELTNGDLTISSAPGEGTTIKLTVPLSRR